MPHYHDFIDLLRLAEKTQYKPVEIKVVNKTRKVAYDCART